MCSVRHGVREERDTEVRAGRLDEYGRNGTGRGRRGIGQRHRKGDYM